MFNSLTGHHHLGGNEPPQGQPRNQPPQRRRRLHGLLALASTVAIGAAMLIAAQPAQAMSAIDGQWTVSHGGTGLVTLNADGTYTSTCVAFTNYTDAWCPSPAGTFQYSTVSVASVTFSGSDGDTASYRVSGPVQHPDTITSMFGSRGDANLVMKPGGAFVCTYWSDTATGLLRWGPSPLVEYDAASDVLYATGSHDVIGPRNVTTYVNLIETAPNYFEVGYACPLPPALPVMGVTSIVDASTLSPNPSVWVPKATVTIEDADGAAVSGASVDGEFLDAGIWSDCVTGADGTCTIGGQAGVGISLASSKFTTVSVTKDGMTWDGQHVETTVYVPTTSAPPTTSTPVPPTTSTPPVTTTPPAPVLTALHIGDLDSASTVSSRKNWQPKVTAAVLDSTGTAVAGATVSGTFAHHSGTLTCVTATDGTCTLGDFSFSKSTKSTEFQVTGVAGSASTYAPSANSDPDGDSTGTAMTVTRP